MFSFHFHLVLSTCFAKYLLLNIILKEKILLLYFTKSLTKLIHYITYRKDVLPKQIGSADKDKP